MSERIYRPSYWSLAVSAFEAARAPVCLGLLAIVDPPRRIWWCLAGIVMVFINQREFLVAIGVHSRAIWTNENGIGIIDGNEQQVEIRWNDITRVGLVRRKKLIARPEIMLMVEKSYSEGLMYVISILSKADMEQLLDVLRAHCPVIDEANTIEEFSSKSKRFGSR